MKTLNLYSLIVFSLTFSVKSINAQTLPGKQENSLRAPKDIIIDGKLDDWGSSLQAYNKAIQLYYSIANDDDNLYLAIQIKNPYIINKAISGAITLTVNNQDKKKDEHFPAISFPLLNGSDGSAIRANLKSKSSNADSLVDAANKQLINALKEIKLSDVDGISDTLTNTHTTNRSYFWRYPLYYLPFGFYITINNKYNIQAAAHFTGKMIYNYELAIPLKYLNIVPGKKFAYNIRLNGALATSGASTAGYTVVRVYRNGVGETLDEDILYPTDAWGEYTLAGKN